MSMREHRVRCTGRNRPWANGRVPHPRASTCTLRAAHVGIANVPMEDYPHLQAVTCTLRAALVGIAHGPTSGRHRLASCALSRQESLMGPWEGTPATSLREHPVRCTGRKRPWVHWRAPHPRAYTTIHEHPVHCTGRNRSWARRRAPHPPESTSVLCAAQVGIAQGSLGEHTIHEPPRAPCELHM